MNDMLKMMVSVLIGAMVGAGVVMVVWFSSGSSQVQSLATGTDSAPSTFDGEDTHVSPPAVPTDQSDSGTVKEAPKQTSPQNTEVEPNMKAENDRLAQEVEVLKERLAEYEAPRPTEKRVFRFGIKPKAPTFDKADWPKMAGHILEMKDVIATLPDDIRKTGRPSDETMAKLQKHNTPLAMFAIGSAAELGGSGPNGAFCHPAVMANLLRSSLKQAGYPLREDQEASIATLGEAWAAEEAQRMAKYDDATFELEKTVEEVDGKVRFMRAVKRLLTPEQHDAVFRPETEERANLDLFCPALIYVMRQPVPAESIPDGVEALMGMLCRVAGVEPKEEEKPSYEWIFNQWIEELPFCKEPKSREHIDVMFPKIDALQAYAKAQVGALKRIRDLGRLTPEETQKLRKVRSLLCPQCVPTRTKTPDTPPDDGGD